MLYVLLKELILPMTFELLLQTVSLLKTCFMKCFYFHLVIIKY